MEDAGEILAGVYSLGIAATLFAGGRMLCIGEKTSLRFEELSKFVI